jgi:hypothetical protein
MKPERMMRNPDIIILTADGERLVACHAAHRFCLRLRSSGAAFALETFPTDGLVPSA